MKKTTLFMAVALFLGAMSVSAAELASGVINNAIPQGWEYITNNPEYPTPSFYKDGGLKMNFETMGIASPAFAAQSEVKVTIAIAALNENTKTAASEDAFTITGLNAEGAEVATATLKTVVAGDNEASLKGTGIVKIKVIMTGYPHNGNKYCNVSLSGVTVEGEADSGVENVTATTPSFFVQGSELLVSNVAEGTTVEIYNALGAKVQTSVFDGAAINVSDLAKGIYVVRAGNYAQKVMF